MIMRPQMDYNAVITTVEETTTVVASGMMLSTTSEPGSHHHQTPPLPSPPTPLPSPPSDSSLHSVLTISELTNSPASPPPPPPPATNVSCSTPNVSSQDVDDETMVDADEEEDEEESGFVSSSIDDVADEEVVATMYPVIGSSSCEEDEEIFTCDVVTATTDDDGLTPSTHAAPPPHLSSMNLNFVEENPVSLLAGWNGVPSSAAAASGTNGTPTSFTVPPPSINDLISQSFINPELACDSVLDSLDGNGSGSDLDSGDENVSGKMMDGKKQRLPLEDFMRKIVFQINSTSDKVWSNLLLDFTKSFAEYQVPYNGFASNDYDLLLDILNIAMKNLESTAVDRRVFASRLLLNINELLNGQLIRDKVMPVLKRVLDSILDPGLANSTDKTMPSDSTALRFNLCFVLAHFAQRLGFCYFVSHIFPYFERLASTLPFNGSSTSSSATSSATSPPPPPATKSTIATDFALIDSLIFLLSTVLHYNEVLSKKCTPDATTKDTVFNLDLLPGEDDDEDTNSLDDDDDQPSSTVASAASASDGHRHMTVKEVFDFISDRFIPLLKKLFEALLDAIVHYRSFGLSLEQEALDCFIQWKDQNRSTNESIIQTTYGHYQTFIFFILLLRDYLKKSCYQDDGDGSERGADQEEEIEIMIEVMEAKFTKLDQWYRYFYAKLVRFLYEPPARIFTRKQPHQQPQPQQQPEQPPVVMEKEAVEEMHCDDDEEDDDVAIEEKTKELELAEVVSSGPTSTLLVNRCELTKINVLTDDDANANPGMLTEEDDEQQQQQQHANLVSSTTSSSTPPPPTNNSSFIGKFQLTESKLSLLTAGQQLQGGGGGGGSPINAAMLSNSRIASIREHQIQAHHHFSSSVSSEIFGFFEFKTISCKAALINSIPILFDLYYITQSNSEIANAAVELKNSAASSAAEDRTSNQPDLTATSSALLGGSSAESSAPVVAVAAAALHTPADVDICQPFVVSLNSIVLDPNPEIVLKMMNVFHKLIGRLPNSMRFYSFLVNVLHSQNVLVLANLGNKISDMMAAMIRGVVRHGVEGVGAANQVYDPVYIQSAVEYILAAFLRSEAFLSSKPNWRLYIQYLEVLLDLSRMVSPGLIKKLIIPRLMMRFNTTRHIPCRQAVTRCLLIIYLEQFASGDLTNPTATTPTCSPHNNNTLGFDIFSWFDANLRTAPKYQQRQVYLDVYAIFLRLLFDGRPSSGGSLRQYFTMLEATDANLYLVDLTGICPKLHFVEWEKTTPKGGGGQQQLAEEGERLRLIGLIIMRNEVLEKLVQIICEDKVATIRAAACSVLHSVITVMKSVVIASHLELEDCSAARTLTGFVKVELMELLFERAHLDKDRLTVGQLKRLFKLVNEVRQDLNLCPRVLAEEEKTSSDEFGTPTEGGEEFEEILDEVYVLVDELLRAIQEVPKKEPVFFGPKPPKMQGVQGPKPVVVVQEMAMMQNTTTVVQELPKIVWEPPQIEVFQQPEDKMVIEETEVEVVTFEDVPMFEVPMVEEETVDEMMADQLEVELLEVPDSGEQTSLESSLNTLTVSTPPIPTESEPIVVFPSIAASGALTMDSTSPPAKTATTTATTSPRRGIIIISGPELINAKAESTSSFSSGKSKKKSKKVAAAAAAGGGFSKNKSGSSTSTFGGGCSPPKSRSPPLKSSSASCSSTGNKRISPCSLIPSASSASSASACAASTTQQQILSSITQTRSTGGGGRHVFVKLPPNGGSGLNSAAATGGHHGGHGHHQRQPGVQSYVKSPRLNQPKSSRNYELRPILNAYTLTPIQGQIQGQRNPKGALLPTPSGPPLLNQSSKLPVMQQQQQQQAPPPYSAMPVTSNGTAAAVTSIMSSVPSVTSSCPNYFLPNPYQQHFSGPSPPLHHHQHQHHQHQHHSSQHSSSGPQLIISAVPPSSGQPGQQQQQHTKSHIALANHRQSTKSTSNHHRQQNNITATTITINTTTTNSSRCTSSAAKSSTSFSANTANYLNNNYSRKQQGGGGANGSKKMSPVPGTVKILSSRSKEAKSACDQSLDISLLDETMDSGHSTITTAMTTTTIDANANCYAELPEVSGVAVEQGTS